MDLAKKLVDAMKKDRFNCPYCCVYALFEFCSSRKISLTEIREAACPNCGNVVVQIREFNPTLKQRPMGGFITKENPGDWNIVWPRKRLLCSDEKIPIEIREDLNNAHSIIDISPDAAAGLSRRVLETILKKYLGLKGKDLKALVEASKQVLHPRIFELLDGVREFGNFGAHPKEDSTSGMRLNTELEEAAFTLKALKELVEDEFLHKARSNDLLEQLEEKKERAKKGEKV